MGNIEIDPKTGAPISRPVSSIPSSVNIPAVNKNAKPDSDVKSPFVVSPNNPPTNPSDMGVSDYSAREEREGNTEAAQIREKAQAGLNVRDSSVDQQGRPDKLPDGPRTTAPVSVGGSGPTNVVNETNPSFAEKDKSLDIKTPMELSKGIGNTVDGTAVPNGRFNLETGARNTNQDNPNKKDDLPTTRTPPRMTTYSIGGEKSMSSQERREATPKSRTRAVQIPAHVQPLILQTLKDNGMDTQQQGKALQRIAEILEENVRVESLPQGERELNQDLQKPLKDVGTDNTKEPR